MKNATMVVAIEDGALALTLVSEQNRGSLLGLVRLVRDHAPAGEWFVYDDGTPRPVSNPARIRDRHLDCRPNFKSDDECAALLLLASGAGYDVRAERNLASAYPLAYRLWRLAKKLPPMTSAA